MKNIIINEWNHCGWIHDQLTFLNTLKREHQQVFFRDFNLHPRVFESAKKENKDSCGGIISYQVSNWSLKKGEV